MACAGVAVGVPSVTRQNNAFLLFAASCREQHNHGIMPTPPPHFHDHYDPPMPQTF